MAALLASRELLHLLANAARPSLLARVASLHADTAAAVDRFAAQRRHVSYLRPDGTFNPEFDKPSAGYSYPPSTSSAPPMDGSSFMEDSSDEYAFLEMAMPVKAIEQVEWLPHGAEADISLSPSMQHKIVWEKIRHCLWKGQHEAAVSWFRQDPIVISTPEEAMPFKVAVNEMQRFLMRERSKDIDALMGFAVLLASKGHVVDGGRRRLLSHIVRYSAPDTAERFERFWGLFTSQIRLTSSNVAFDRQRKRNYDLANLTNLVIRNLCLTGKYRPAIALIRHARVNLQLEFGEHPGLWTRTYEILFQEVSRQGDNAILDDLVVTYKQDRPHAAHWQSFLKRREGPFSENAVLTYSNRHLRRKLMSGNLPKTRELVGMMGKDQSQGKLHTVDRFGRWSMNSDRWSPGQKLRHGTLWHTARIYRLLVSRRPQAARRVLAILAEDLSLVGVPDVIVRHLRTTHPAVFEPSQSTIPKPWISSHTMVLVLKAWFLLNPGFSDVMATYESFVREAYGAAGKEKYSTPIQALPDQVSFQPFLRALSNVNRPDAALTILRDMRDRGVMPSAHNWDIILGSLAKLGEVKLVNEVMMRRGQKIQLEIKAGNNAGQLRIAEGKVTDSLEVTAARLEQPSASAPLATSLTALQQLDASAPVRLPDSLTSWIDGFRLPAADATSFNSIIRGLSNAGLYNTAKAYRDQLYRSRDANGSLLYRWGASRKTDATLAILKSKLAFQERRLNRMRAPAES